MKKTVVFALAVILCIGAVFGGCMPNNGKTPDKYTDIRWITYDYSFCIKPADDCSGFYKFNDKKYNIKVTFDSSVLTAVDTDKDNTELFSGEWTYQTNDSGNETLYIYNIKFNKKDYKEFESNFAEIATLKQEKI